MDRGYKSGGSVITATLYIDVEQDLKALPSITNQVLRKPPEDRKINGQKVAVLFIVYHREVVRSTYVYSFCEAENFVACGIFLSTQVGESLISKPLNF